MNFELGVLEPDWPGRAGHDHDQRFASTCIISMYVRVSDMPDIRVSTRPRHGHATLSCASMHVEITIHDGRESQGDISRRCIANACMIYIALSAVTPLG